MHPNNIHQQGYNFKKLIESNPKLAHFVFTNSYGNETIDFSVPQAILELNRALLKYHYQVDNWNIPSQYLCPAIPSRADYIHYLADLLKYSNNNDVITGLDIGVGANCIYPILGNKIYNWNMVGSDIDSKAVESAIKNVNSSSSLSKHISILHQENPANIFKGIIKPNEYYHFTMCNPPFHKSKEEAEKGTHRKITNLQKGKPKLARNTLQLNFGGQANELWCNGGEALFIKRMIKESVEFKDQVTWFTSLVSKKENLPKIYKQLEKLSATYTTIAMEQGNKKSRFIAWKLD